MYCVFYGVRILSFTQCRLVSKFRLLYPNIFLSKYIFCRFLSYSKISTSNYALFSQIDWTSGRVEEIFKGLRLSRYCYTHECLSNLFVISIYYILLYCFALHYIHEHFGLGRFVTGTHLPRSLCGLCSFVLSA